MTSWTWQDPWKAVLPKSPQGINAKRELIVLSDFRKSDWADTGNSFLNLKKRLESEDL